MKPESIDLFAGYVALTYPRGAVNTTHENPPIPGWYHCTNSWPDYWARHWDGLTWTFDAVPFHSQTRVIRTSSAEQLRLVNSRRKYPHEMTGHVWTGAPLQGIEP